MKRLTRFLCSENGPAAVEYAILLAGIILVCIVSLTLVGGQASNFWSNNQQELQNAFSGP